MGGHHSRGFTLIEAGVALALGAIVALGASFAINGLVSSFRKGDFAVQAQAARSALKRIIRTDACRINTQGLVVANPSGSVPPGTGYSVTVGGANPGSPAALTPGSFNTSTDPASPRPISMMRFEPYQLGGQAIQLRKCVAYSGTTLGLCGATPPAGRVVFEASFQLLLQKGSGPLAPSTTVEEMVSLFGTSVSGNITIDGCRPSLGTGSGSGSPPTVESPPEETFCNLLGPGGNPDGPVVTPPTGPMTGLVKARYAGGRCDLRQMLAYAAQGRNGNFVQHFQEPMLRVITPTSGCRLTSIPSYRGFAIGFDRGSGSPTAGTGPFVCRDPNFAPSCQTPYTGISQTGCVRTKTPAGLDCGPLGFEVEFNNSGTFQTNAACYEYDDPSNLGAHVCGKHCN